MALQLYLNIREIRLRDAAPEPRSPTIAPKSAAGKKPKPGHPVNTDGTACPGEWGTEV